MKVLVIDDSVENLEIMSMVLGSMGYDVLIAENGTDGYHKALADIPSLILTDYHMPGLSGTELISKIRGTESLQDVPIIAMTADIYAKQDLLDAGCNACLLKPVRKGSLLRTIKQILANIV